METDGFVKMRMSATLRSKLAAIMHHAQTLEGLTSVIATLDTTEMEKHAKTWMNAPSKLTIAVSMQFAVIPLEHTIVPASLGFTGMDGHAKM